MFVQISGVLTLHGLRAAHGAFCPQPLVCSLYALCPSRGCPVPEPPAEPLWLDQKAPGSRLHFLVHLLQPFPFLGLPSLTPFVIAPRFFFLSGFQVASQCRFFRSTPLSIMLAAEQYQTWPNGQTSFRPTAQTSGRWTGFGRSLSSISAADTAIASPSPHPVSSSKTGWL